MTKLDEDLAAVENWSYNPEDGYPMCAVCGDEYNLHEDCEPTPCCDRCSHDMTDRLIVEVRRLQSLINTPHVADFIDAVRIEAAHQQERWSSEHDAGKTDADWFWLVGYLAGKALHKPDKKLHHIITTAAVLLNWHRHATGETTGMRPGIAPPDIA